MVNWLALIILIFLIGSYCTVAKRVIFESFTNNTGHLEFKEDLCSDSSSSDDSESDDDEEAEAPSRTESHESRVDDTIIIKDNHVDFCGSITAALKKTQDYLRTYNLSIPVIVEVRNCDEINKKDHNKTILLMNNGTQSLTSLISQLLEFLPYQTGWKFMLRSEHLSGKDKQIALERNDVNIITGLFTSISPSG